MSAPEFTIGSSRLTLVQGDITKQTVDGIVNAANAQLAGGGGVDGAIHRVGGPAIMAECRQIGGCPTGTAVTTTAGDLDARKVIHTAGPIWKTGTHGENIKLESCYRASLDQAKEHGLKTVAFPSISTGVYSFPIDRASIIAIKTIIDWLRENPDVVDEVRMVLFSKSDFDVYADALQQVGGTMTG